MSNLVYMKRFIFLSSFASFGFCFQFDLSIFFRTFFFFWFLRVHTQHKCSKNQIDWIQRRMYWCEKSEHVRSNRCQWAHKTIEFHFVFVHNWPNKKYAPNKKRQRRRARRMKAQPRNEIAIICRDLKLACECVCEIAFAISRNLLTNFCVRFATRCTVFCSVWCHWNEIESRIDEELAEFFFFIGAIAMANGIVTTMIRTRSNGTLQMWCINSDETNRMRLLNECHAHISNWYAPPHSNFVSSFILTAFAFQFQQIYWQKSKLMISYRIVDGIGILPAIIDDTQTTRDTIFS